jgi:hypothetical protein
VTHSLEAKSMDRAPSSLLHPAVRGQLPRPPMPSISVIAAAQVVRSICEEESWAHHRPGKSSWCVRRTIFFQLTRII